MVAFYLQHVDDGRSTYTAAPGIVAMHTLKYQLVFQLRAESSEDLDALIELEDALADTLQGHAEIDGHDIGSGEMNVFVHTDNPVEAFERSRADLRERGLLSTVKVAYRHRDLETYTVLWPVGLASFCVK